MIIKFSLNALVYVPLRARSSILDWPVFSSLSLFSVSATMHTKPTEDWLLVTPMSISDHKGGFFSTSSFTEKLDIRSSAVQPTLESVALNTTSKSNATIRSYSSLACPYLLLL